MHQIRVRVAVCGGQLVSALKPETKQVLEDMKIGVTAKNAAPNCFIL